MVIGRRGEGWLQDLLDVPSARRARSPFYAWRAETATAVRRRELAVLVKMAFEAGRGACGCLRVAAALNRDADLMRELGLRACQPRAYKRSTLPGVEPLASPPDRPGLHRRRPLRRDATKHQRPAAPVLPQGHRPQQAQPGEPQRRHRGAQCPVPQDARLEDTRRSPQRASTVTRTSRCCNDPLNLGESLAA
jgi:hypothetical protein